MNLRGGHLTHYNYVTKWSLQHSTPHYKRTVAEQCCYLTGKWSNAFSHKITLKTLQLKPVLSVCTWSLLDIPNYQPKVRHKYISHFANIYQTVPCLHATLNSLWAWLTKLT
jgi:hypothetical protein